MSVSKSKSYASDVLFIAAVGLFFLPFFISDTVFQFYSQMNTVHGILMSFLKFAVLATLGEVIGLRIKTGFYYRQGFGLLPRAVVWGFLGITIKAAFVIFAKGTPAFLMYLDLDFLGQSVELTTVLIAFSISTAMNLIFAPVMMTMHKITDMHIAQHNGKLSCLVTKIEIAKILQQINWDVQWNFVFKKTIPLFWIPAHTITFLLPADYQVLFAAVLGIVLGVLLAVASNQQVVK